MAVDVSRRNRQPELMDQPGLDLRRHRLALHELAWLNFWSGSARILWPAIRDLARQLAPRRVRLLDVASGAGDVSIALWKKARRTGIDLRVDGCDVSPCAVDFATERAAQRRADIRFFQCDALHGPLPPGYDVICCSLFLHHLEHPDALQLLRKMAAAATHLVLINDLRRTRIGYCLACVATRLLARSEIVHADGPLSVAAAFSIPELEALARETGLTGCTVVPRWPQRLLLTWSRP